MDPDDGLHATRRVLVTRAAGQATALASALREVGLDPVLVPAIAIEFEPGGGPLDDAARRLGDYAWVVVSSTNGTRAILAAAARAMPRLDAARWATIGTTTRRALEREGVDVSFQPSRSSAAAMAAELPVNAGDRVLVVRGNLAGEELPDVLRSRGAAVDDVIAYRTREAPEPSRVLLRRAFSDGPMAAVTFTSGSTVRGLVALGRAEAIDVVSVPCTCIGPETADEARAAGFRVLATSATPDLAAFARATTRSLARQPQEIA